MPERKLVIEVDINDGAVNSIGDLEREILAQNICGQAARKYLCTIVSFSEASFLIDILQGVKVSSSKLKKIFYENKTLPIRNPIYSQYNPCSPVSHSISLFSFHKYLPITATSIGSPQQNTF